jgi:MYXO-CTERM domain-containing protein
MTMMKPHLLAPLALTVILTWTARGDAAALRCYDNPKLSSVPASVQSGQGKLLAAGYLDVTKAPYNADASGAKDAAGAIQQAIGDAYKYSFTVYVPKGTYLLGKPIVAKQLEGFGGCGMSNRKYINVVVGDTTGGTFPVLRAKDGAFAGKTMVTFMFDGPNGAPRHYGSIFRGFTLDMGNNPTATALSMPGAQLCSIEDIVIKGNFNVGINSLPGSGGSTTGVTVLGGNVGIQQDAYRPTPSIHGLVLKNQKQYGIRLNGARGGLIVVGFAISGSGQAGVLIPSADSSSHPSRNLVMVDGTFELSGPAVKASENSMYLRNVYAKTATIVTNGSIGTLAGSAGAWTRVGEYAVSGKFGTPLLIDGQSRGTKTAHEQGVAQVASPPKDLVGMHAWDPAKTPSYFNTKVLDIRDYGATPDQHGDDDAPAINKALEDSVKQKIPVFVPRGRFNVRQPVEVPLGASMIGASFGKSMIYADESWKPSSKTAVLRTEDGVGNVLLMDFATVIHEPAASKGLVAANNMYGFHGRSSNMLLRDMIPDRKPYYAGGKQQWAQTVAYFSGNAGGRVYNLALDYHESNTPTGEHYMFAVEGTKHPLALYQPNTESTANDPQVIIRNAKNVSWYALKFEATNGNRELLHIENSDNVLVLGGSGNYNITTTMVRVKSSSDVAVSLLARQGQGGQSLLVDGKLTIPPGKKITTFRKGKPLGFGELNPPGFPYPGGTAGGGGSDSGLGPDSGVAGGDGGGPIPGHDGGVSAGDGGSTSGDGSSVSGSGDATSEEHRGEDGCSVSTAGGGSPRSVLVLLALVFFFLCQRRD